MKKTTNIDPDIFRLAAEHIFLGFSPEADTRFLIDNAGGCCTALGNAARTYPESYELAQNVFGDTFRPVFIENVCCAYWWAYPALGKRHVYKHTSDQEARIIALLLMAEILEEEQRKPRAKPRAKKRRQWRWLKRAEVLRPTDEGSARVNRPKLQAKSGTNGFITAEALDRVGDCVCHSTLLWRRRVSR